MNFLNDNLIELSQCKIKINNCNLKYPTGDKVSINYKVYTKVWLGIYLIKIPMLVAKINKCILDVDFLEKLNLENIFESVFSNQKGTKKNEVQCFRIDKSSDFDVPSNLKYLFDRDSEHLT